MLIFCDFIQVYIFTTNHHLKDYMSERRQRVVFRGAISDWVYIKTGVPEGSILGLFLFLIFINDIVNDIGSKIRLLADDTSLYKIVHNPQSSADPKQVSAWAKTWLVSFNPPKTESLIITLFITRAGPRSAIGRAPDSSQGSWVRCTVWQRTFVCPYAFSRRALVSYWRKYVHEVLVNRLGGLRVGRKILRN